MVGPSEEILDFVGSHFQGCFQDLIVTFNIHSWALYAVNHLRFLTLVPLARGGDSPYETDVSYVRRKSWI